MGFLNEPPAARVPRRGRRRRVVLVGSAVPPPSPPSLPMVMRLFVLGVAGSRAVTVLVVICVKNISFMLCNECRLRESSIPTLPLLLPPFRRCLFLLFLLFPSESLSLVSSLESYLLLILFLRCKTLSTLSKLLTLLSLSPSEFLREELADPLLVSSSELVQQFVRI